MWGAFDGLSQSGTNVVIILCAAQRIKPPEPRLD
jgi:hypothetical protein